ncbi:MAG: D-alanyl-D-alanine carboxypeptidase/D-alanyl-D-alanine-endopeptidase [Bacteroidota bacterium]
MLKTTTLKLLVFLFVLILFGCTNLMKAQSQTIDATLQLKNEIDLLKNDADLKHAAWSVIVMDVGTGTTLAEYNADMGLEPASVMKIVTTGAALSILGPTFTFSTQLQYTGTIDSNGTLHGNLFIAGSGDPTIGSARFGKIVSTDSIFSDFYLQLKQHNIRHISGKIIADASIFEDNPMAGSWSWEDIGNYYASGAWGLNVNENSYRLYFDAGKTVGEPAKLTSIEPVMSEINFTNHVTTGTNGSGDNVIIFGAPYTYQRILEGTVPVGRKNFDVDGSIPDPPVFLAQMFYKYVCQKGLTIDSSYTTLREMQLQGKSDTNKRIMLFEHFSPPLADMAVPTNLKSVNLFAEAMLKAIGVAKQNQGSLSAGISTIRNFYINNGINLDGFVMEDGCGLSRKNKISTRQLAQILKMLKTDKSFSSFEKTLPVAGKSGGMASLLNGTIAENNMKAKTGNMEKIKSYAGYVKNAGKKDVAFAIIINNYTCSNAILKQKLEKLMLLITQTK